MWINFQSYRAYKWAIKRPQCASQILCTINEKNELDQEQPRLRSVMSKMTSFPAAWAVSNKLGTNFWTLYGAIMEHDMCIVSNILTRRNVYLCLYFIIIIIKSLSISSKSIQLTAQTSTKRRSELPQKIFTVNFNIF